jgi:peptidoglycan/xylan/chitin deacetylase (PgdA/CDA1 family)
LKLLNSWGFTPITFKDYTLAMNGELPLPKRPVILTFENGYRETYRLAFPLLKEFGMNAVVFALGDRTITTDEWDRYLGLYPEQLVPDDELVEMHEGGFEIGSQSLTHPDLTTLTDQAAWNEVALSKEVLESLIGTTVTSFSYPFGSIDKRTKEMVIDAGYKFGCGTDTRSIHVGINSFAIRRIAITNSTNSLSFALKMLSPGEQADWTNSKEVGIPRNTMLKDTRFSERFSTVDGKVI